jgi:hypothetical protein
MAETFKVGDLVFAKVRGYPSWPARVCDDFAGHIKITNIAFQIKNTAIDPVNAKNTRFEVFFFGTYET